MKKTIGMMLLVIGAAGSAMAGTVVPEIDPGSVGSAVALLGGGLLVIRSRRNKK